MLLPAGAARAADLSPGLRRAWGSVFTAFRPEYGGFSNNAASVNCHVNQWVTADHAVFARPTPGFEPLALARFTVGRALLDGGGCGYHRTLYLDADPILLSAAGRLQQLTPDQDWLRRLQPGLIETVQRLLGSSDRDGLVVCRALSRNPGYYRVRRRDRRPRPPRGPTGPAAAHSPGPKGYPAWPSRPSAG